MRGQKPGSAPPRQRERNPASRSNADKRGERAANGVQQQKQAIDQVQRRVRDDGVDQVEDVHKTSITGWL